MERRFYGGVICDTAECFHDLGEFVRTLGVGYKTDDL